MSKSLSAAVAGVVAMLLWASMPTLIKYGTDGLDVFEFITLRFGLPLLAIAPFAPGVLAKVRDVGWRRWLTLATAMQAHVVLQVYSLKHDMPASWHGLVFALGVPLTLVALKVRPNVTTTVSLAAAVIGIGLFVDHQNLDNYPTEASILAIVGSMVAWVVLTVQMVHLQRRLNDGEVLVLFLLLMAPAVLAMAPFAAWRWPTPVAGAAIVSLAAGVALGMVLFSFSVRHLRIFGVSIQHLKIIFAALIATAFRGEPPLAPVQVVAIVIVVGALVMLRKLEGEM